MALLHLDSESRQMTGATSAEAIFAQGRIYRKEKGFCQQLNAKMAKITWVSYGSGSERPEKMLLPIMFFAQGRIHRKGVLASSGVRKWLK